MWHFAVRNADEDRRAELEDALTRADDRHRQPARPGAAQERRHHPGLAPSFRAPSWWKGDKAAFNSSVRGADEIRRADATGGASLRRRRVR